MDRRALLAGAAGAVAGGPLARAAGSRSLPGSVARPAGITILPSRVIWGADHRPRDGSESCFFTLEVPGKDPGITSASAELFVGSSSVQRIEHGLPWIAATRMGTDGSERFRFTFRQPRSLRVDRCEMTLRTAEGQAKLSVDLEHYSARTKLIAPFEGPGIVDQAWMVNNGHTNTTEQFAVDLLALSETCGRGSPEPRVNTDYAGWGRQIIAPADGVIARVEDGIPSQPRIEDIDEESFTLTDGRRVGGGNQVVIDHENGEFSLLCHMQPSSIGVEVGARVRQGDPLGKLGNSGMSTEPHLHYQLQDAAEGGFSLPFRFENVPIALHRGLYFTT